MEKSSCGNSSDDSPCQWIGEDLLLHVKVLPRSSREAIVGIRDNLLLIKLTAPPVDGKANQALIKFLSKSFAVPQSRISIEKGEASKTKRIRICAPRALPSAIENFKKYN